MDVGEMLIFADCQNLIDYLKRLQLLHMKASHILITFRCRISDLRAIYFFYTKIFFVNLLWFPLFSYVTK